MNKFISKRLIITPSANLLPKAKTIIKQYKLLNPKIEIISSKSQFPSVPEGLNTSMSRKYVDESLRIYAQSDSVGVDKTIDFISDKPESICPMGKPCNNCPFACDL